MTGRAVIEAIPIRQRKRANLTDPKASLFNICQTRRVCQVGDFVTNLSACFRVLRGLTRTYPRSSASSAA